MSEPIFVLIGGNPSSYPGYFELAVRSIKFLKKNIPAANVGVIVLPGTGNVQTVIESQLEEKKLDSSNIKVVEGKKSFGDWNNSQYILDVASFAGQYDPVIYLDVDTIILRDLTPYIEKFTSSGKKYGFLSDFVNDHANFKEKWEGPLFIPQTTILFLRSENIPQLTQAWVDNWNPWIKPDPFVTIKDPAPGYKYSRVSIQQYSLGQTIYKIVQNFDTEVSVIPRSELSLCRNFDVESQKTKLKFLNAGSSYSNEGKIIVTINVQSGEVYENQDAFGGKGDPYVAVKVGEWERKTEVIKNTKTPVWNEEFIFNRSNYWEANNILLTLWDWDGVTRNDEVGTVQLSLLGKKVHQQGNPTAYTRPVLDKNGKERGKLNFTAEFYVELLDDEGVAIKSKDLAVGGKKSAIIKVIGGKVYENHDTDGDDDPYVKVLLGGVTQQTKVIKNTQEPVWNQEFSFDAITDTNVTFELYDQDKLTKDDLIGTGKLSLTQFANNKSRISVPVYDVEEKEQGKIEVEALLVVEAPPPPPKEPTPPPKESAPPPPTTEEPRPLGVDGKKKAVINVIGAKIYEQHDVVGADDPYVKLIVGGVAQKTKVIQETQEPVWNQEFTFDDITDTNVAFEVYDQDKLTKDDLIGSGTLSLVQFANNKSRISVPVYDVKGKEQGKIDVDALLVVETPKAVAKEAPPPPPEEPAPPAKEPTPPPKEPTPPPKEPTPPPKEPIPPPPPAKEPTPLAVDGKKKAVINVIGAKIYERHDVDGYDDPYVKLIVGGVTQKTKVIQETQEPVWNQEFTFDDITDINVAFEVYDQDKLTKDDLIGSGTLSLVQFANNKSRISVPVYDVKGKEQGKIDVDALLVVETPKAVAKEAPPPPPEEPAPPAKEPTLLAKEAPPSPTKVPTLPAKEPTPKQRSPVPSSSPPSVAPVKTATYVVFVETGKVIKSHDFFGKGDPYVIVKVNGVEKRTTTKMNTKTPIYNERLSFDDVPVTTSQIEISIYDKNDLKADSFIGQAIYTLSNLKNNKVSLKDFSLLEKNKQAATLNFTVEIKP